MMSSPLLEALAKRKKKRGRGIPKTKVALPLTIRRRYQAELRVFVESIFAEIREKIIPNVARWTEERNRTLNRFDSWDEEIERAISAISIFGAIGADRAAGELSARASRIERWNVKEWSKAMTAALGVDVTSVSGIDGQFIASELSSWVRENTKLIKSLPDQLLTDVEGIVQRGVRSGEPASEISKTIRKRFNVTKAKADLIAQDQVSKLHGQLTKARNENLGVERYVWRTGQDERVRESHQVLDGMLCRWDDPNIFSDDEGETWRSRSSIGGFEGHPGEDFRCRCVSSPDLRDILESLDN